MRRIQYRHASPAIRAAVRQAAVRWETTDGTPLVELLDKPSNRSEAVAHAYLEPVEQVATWPTGVVDAFYRNAIARGYLLPEERS